MRRLLCALFFLALSTPLYAQTHYCDVPQPTSLTAASGAPITLGFCHDGKDVNGNPGQPSGFALYDNGLRTTPVFLKGTTSSTSGKTVYTYATTVPTATGLHTLQTAWLSGTVEGAKSNPFALTVVAPALTAPTNLSAQ